MAMQAALASLMGPAGAGPGGGGTGPPPNSLGLGAPPPAMPGLPPSPEMMGQMPTGSTANNAKQAADVAISSLTDAKGYFPNMGPMIDALIAQFQQSNAAPTPPAPVGVPGGPGAALPTVPPTADSGTKGAL